MAECPEVCEHLHLPAQSGQHPDPQGHAPHLQPRALPGSGGPPARRDPGSLPHVRPDRRLPGRDRGRLRADAVAGRGVRLRRRVHVPLLAPAGHRGRRGACPTTSRPRSSASGSRASWRWCSARRPRGRPASWARTREVLVEGPSRTDPSRLRGRLSQNIAVNFDGTAAPGALVRVAIERATFDDPLRPSGRGSRAGGPRPRLRSWWSPGRRRPARARWPTPRPSRSAARSWWPTRSSATAAWRSPPTRPSARARWPRCPTTRSATWRWTSARRRPASPGWRTRRSTPRCARGRVPVVSGGHRPVRAGGRGARWRFPEEADPGAAGLGRGARGPRPGRPPWPQLRDARSRGGRARGRGQPAPPGARPGGGGRPPGPAGGGGRPVVGGRCGDPPCWWGSPARARSWTGASPSACGASWTTAWWPS